LKPLGIWLSMAYFFIPALIFAGAYYLIMPWLLNKGVLPYYAYAIGLGVPLVGLLIAALMAYTLEGNPMRWSALMSRFGYRPLSGRDLLVVAIIFAVEMLLYFGLSLITSWLIRRQILPIPTGLPPFLDPRTVWTQDTLEAATGGLKGNWLLLLLSAVLLIVNVVGEEFWWRGIVLARQRLAFGAGTLVVHALLWTMFHRFKYWDLLNLLPLSFGLTFAVLYLKNSSAGLLMHFISNGVGLVPIALGVLGRGS